MERSFNPYEDENTIKTTDSILIVCKYAGALHLFSSKRGNSGTIYKLLYKLIFLKIQRKKLNAGSLC
jgi:hypothetical protein